MRRSTVHPSDPQRAHLRPSLSRRRIAAVAAVAALTLTACGSGRTDTPSSSSAASGGGATSSSGSSGSSGPATGSSSSSGGTGATGQPVKIGTTDKVVTIDPAGSYDNGSLMLQTQVFQYLMVVAPGGDGKPTPDAAESCDFTDSGATYTCTLKSGLTFSNGDPLTSKDVVFSYERIKKINDPNGPSSLLAGMTKVEAKDDSTVVFTLASANDQTWPSILGTAAGPIVDSKVFAADAVLDDAKVIGSGPYKLASGYQKNQLAALEPNASYQGNGGAVVNTGVTLQYYADASNLKLAVEQGDIDVAWRSLDAQSISDLRGETDKVKVLDGPGGAIRYIVFNLKTMPGDNEAAKLAIRRAVAYSVDRKSLASNIYQDTFDPLYSMVASGFLGHVDAFKDEFGDAPDKAKAQEELTKAGVATPVTLNLQYNPDHYGPGSADEYGEVKRQLEATGLFTVNLQSTEWTTYSKERVADAYPVYQLGWFPDFPDSDNYLQPFVTPGNFVGAHYCDDPATVPTATVGSRPCDTDGVLPLIEKERTSSGSDREDALKQLQVISATKTLPTLPLLQGKQLAVTGLGISGVDKTLDASFLFRFWTISKS